MESLSAYAYITAFLGFNDDDVCTIRRVVDTGVQVSGYMTWRPEQYGDEDGDEDRDTDGDGDESLMSIAGIWKRGNN